MAPRDDMTWITVVFVKCATCTSQPVSFLLAFFSFCLSVVGCASVASAVQGRFTDFVWHVIKTTKLGAITCVHGIVTPGNPFLEVIFNPTENHQATKEQETTDHLSERFECNICGRSYKHQFHLKAHVRECSVEPLFSCEICLKRFYHSRNLSRHMQNVHNHPKKKSLHHSHHAQEAQNQMSQQQIVEQVTVPMILIPSAQQVQQNPTFALPADPN
ncbi:zinc finger protein Gfi-1b-like [Cimex lectularius]|uniref:C2H2-type domain-containing protein n=1 Tax=Cimex lectularius TaxID=79782 RepID=A0A8I6SBS2_CIMLE|nr:zinc finger protein Gfi-1b-like [Cimex lectularius]